MNIASANAGDEISSSTKAESRQDRDERAREDREQRDRPRQEIAPSSIATRAGTSRASSLRRRRPRSRSDVTWASPMTPLFSKKYASIIGVATAMEPPRARPPLPVPPRRLRHPARVAARSEAHQRLRLRLRRPLQYLPDRHLGGPCRRQHRHGVRGARAPTQLRRRRCVAGAHDPAHPGPRRPRGGRRPVSRRGHRDRRAGEQRGPPGGRRPHPGVPRATQRLRVCRGDREPPCTTSRTIWGAWRRRRRTPGRPSPSRIGTRSSWAASASS